MDYPGTPPNKLGIRLAGSLAPTARDTPSKLAKERRKIGVAGTLPGTGVDIHPSEWPSLDFSSTPRTQLLQSPSPESKTMTPVQAAHTRHRANVEGEVGASAAKNRPLAAASGTGTSLAGAGRTRVAVRLRPPNEDERAQDQFQSCISVDAVQKSVDISRSFLNKKQYLFDAVFGETAHTTEIFQSVVHPHVKHVVEGYSAVVTAYGQSATGKTYTLGSDAGSVSSGCILQACSELFEALHSNGRPGTGAFNLYASMVELCNEEMRDLLVADKSDRSRGQVIRFEPQTHRIKAASCHQISSVEDCVAILRRGSKRRYQHQSLAHERSEHLGHMLVKLILDRGARLVDCHPDHHLDQNGLFGNPDKQRGICSSLSFVELAGSEWRDRNPASYINVSGGRSPEDARHISNALASLSAVIHARKNDLPMRGESKLSNLLHQALSGKVYFSVIITIGPSVDFLHETTTSLLFGKRTMLLESTPLWNHEPGVVASEDLHESPINPLLSPEHRVASATPGKKRAGAIFSGGGKAPRQAQTVSPKARRKIDYHTSRVRSSAHDHPDLEFSNYVSRQLGLEDRRFDDDDEAEEAPHLLDKVNNPPGHDSMGALEQHGSARKRQLAFEATASTCLTGSSLGSAQNMANLVQHNVAAQEMTGLRLVLEDVLEVHQQAMDVHASLPSTMVLDEVQAHTHLSTFRSILKHLLDRPDGVQVRCLSEAQDTQRRGHAAARASARSCRAPTRRGPLTVLIEIVMDFWVVYRKLWVEYWKYVLPVYVALFSLSPSLWLFVVQLHTSNYSNKQAGLSFVTSNCTRGTRHPAGSAKQITAGTRTACSRHANIYTKPPARHSQRVTGPIISQQQNGSRSGGRSIFSKSCSARLSTSPPTVADNHAGCRRRERPDTCVTARQCHTKVEVAHQDLRR